MTKTIYEDARHNRLLLIQHNSLSDEASTPTPHSPGAQTPRRQSETEDRKHQDEPSTPSPTEAVASNTDHPPTPDQTSDHRRRTDDPSPRKARPRAESQTLRLDVQTPSLHG